MILHEDFGLEGLNFALLMGLVGFGFSLCILVMMLFSLGVLKVEIDFKILEKKIEKLIIHVFSL